jgi:hypothetical protein
MSIWCYIWHVTGMTFNETSNTGLIIEETSHEEVSKFEINDLVNIFIGFQNSDEDDPNEWLKIKVCESGLQHMTDANIISAATEKKR